MRQLDIICSKEYLAFPSLEYLFSPKQSLEIL